MARALRLPRSLAVATACPPNSSVSSAARRASWGIRLSAVAALSASFPTPAKPSPASSAPMPTNWNACPTRKRGFNAFPAMSAILKRSPIMPSVFAFRSSSAPITSSVISIHPSKAGLRSSTVAFAISMMPAVTSPATETTPVRSGSSSTSTSFRSFRRLSFHVFVAAAFSSTAPVLSSSKEDASNGKRHHQTLRLAGSY